MNVNMFALIILFNVCLVCAQKYYLTHDDIRKRLDEYNGQKTETVVAEDSSEAQDMDADEQVEYAESGHYLKPHYHYGGVGKHNILGDEIGLLLVVAAIAILFGFLS